MVGKLRCLLSVYYGTALFAYVNQPEEPSVAKFFTNELVLTEWRRNIIGLRMF
jgi:hypothetical protein